MSEVIVKFTVMPGGVTFCCTCQANAGPVPEPEPPYEIQVLQHRYLTTDRAVNEAYGHLVESHAAVFPLRFSNPSVITDVFSFSILFKPAPQGGVA